MVIAIVFYMRTITNWTRVQTDSETHTHSDTIMLFSWATPNHTWSCYNWSRKLTFVFNIRFTASALDVMALKFISSVSFYTLLTKHPSQLQGLCSHDVQPHPEVHPYSWSSSMGHTADHRQTTIRGKKNSALLPGHFNGFQWAISGHDLLYPYSRMIIVIDR